MYFLFFQDYILERVDSCWVNTLVKTVPSVNDSFTEKVASHIPAASVFFSQKIILNYIKLLSDVMYQDIPLEVRGEIESARMNKLCERLVAKICASDVVATSSYAILHEGWRWAI